MEAAGFARAQVAGGWKLWLWPCIHGHVHALGLGQEGGGAQAGARLSDSARQGGSRSCIIGARPLSALDNCVILPEHQQFFEKNLLQHHKRNGFGNILRALDYLRMKWAQGIVQDWTEILPDLQVFIV